MTDRRPPDTHRQQARHRQRKRRSHFARPIFLVLVTSLGVAGVFLLVMLSLTGQSRLIDTTFITDGLDRAYIATPGMWLTPGRDLHFAAWQRVRMRA